MTEDLKVVYWDASAILSVLFKDRHSINAHRCLNVEGVHLLSTLTYSETCAVVARMKRERILSDILIQAALTELNHGYWRQITTTPHWEIIQPLSVKWSLRGADLWHLSAAKTLQSELPEIVLLTFDTRLKKAAAGEGLLDSKSIRP